LLKQKNNIFAPNINSKQNKKMKNLIIAAIAVLSIGVVSAQEQTKKGKWLIEANTGFGDRVGTTQIGFNSTEFGSSYNVGAEGGYFVMDNLAIKAGLGFGGNNPKNDKSTSVFSYKIGAKYYVINTIPFELSYNGVTFSDNNGKNPSFLGIQGGYAIFLGNNVSIEPGLRYNYSLLKKEDGGVSAFQFNVGFALHF
jgi:Outer membrane protein beta-barrel domain